MEGKGEAGEWAEKQGENGMYTALGRLSCKNCNLSVSAGSDIKESRGE